VSRSRPRLDVNSVRAAGMIANLPLDAEQAETVVDVLAEAVEDADLLRAAELGDTQPAVVFRASWRAE
jgi:hypothetical protein